MPNKENFNHIFPFLYYNCFFREIRSRNKDGNMNNENVAKLMNIKQEIDAFFKAKLSNEQNNNFNIYHKVLDRLMDKKCCNCHENLNKKFI